MATNYFGGLQTTGNYRYGVKQNSDGSYGIDYFYVDPRNGQPVPVNREELQKSGLLTDGLFNNAAKVAQQAGVPPTALNQINPAYQNFGSGTIGPRPESGEVQGISKQADGVTNSFASLSSGSSGSTGGSHTAEYGGRFYNLDDPNEQSAYYRDANAGALSDADTAYSKTIDNLGRSRSNLDYNAQRYLQSLLDQRKQLETEKQNFFADTEKQGKQFVQDKSVGDVNRGNYFSGLGANAFQSSQATSQDYADTQFAQGLGDIQRSEAQADEAYGRGFGQLDNAQTDYARQNSQDVADLTTAANEATTTRDRTKQQAQTSILGGIADVTGKPVTDYASKYNYSPVSVSTTGPDLTGASTYTKFNPGASAVSSGGAASKFAGVGTSDGLNPLPNYFGYTPDEKTKKNLTNYFAGAY